ncbi:hypothetical protein QTJ16_001003 [Diplocarpon rosae]|uniref:Plethodontid modulating factor n=1 Tax=Diplocarpon rosae TaxID=946125 RepID=A0AAD9WH65_9HELO|nr:hypothetical protein QTJ16_001003 [Diplocarpon rosae]PBP26571.1 hypothetical protein BUE80_DR002489 [Diplocarpon rosae]
MKLTIVLLLAQAFAAQAMYCTDYGINLSNGDFCPGKRHSFCCSRNALKPEGDFKIPRSCVSLKDAYNVDVTRYCGHSPVMCC